MKGTNKMTQTAKITPQKNFDTVAKNRKEKHFYQEYAVHFTIVKF